MADGIVDVNLSTLLLEQPNVRFANTFLDDTYRDYAVNGEAIMDKISGEYFIKRTSDGRIVSFSQNKKFIHDTVFELQVALSNYASFTYPTDSLNAFYVSTNYDLASIDSAMSRDIINSDFVLPEVVDGLSESKQIKFRISKDSNGFFCKPLTRDCDKVYIEFINNMYNKYVSSYDGTDTTISNEKALYDTDTSWKYNDATITFEITAYKSASSTGDEETQTFTKTQDIKVNEEICVYIGTDEILDVMTLGYDQLTIQVSEITFKKLHFMLDNKSLLETEFGSTFTLDFNQGLSIFSTPDSDVQVNTFNVMSFIDNATDVTLCGNEFIATMLDILSVQHYMEKINSMQQASPFILSSSRPMDGLWLNNHIWAETIRTVHQGGTYTNATGGENTITMLQEYIADPLNVYATMSDDASNLDAFVITNE